MILIDTHAHLYWDSYKEDLDQIIQRSIEAGVTTIINVGVDVEKSQIALKQVADELVKYPGLSTYSTIGIHPHEAIKYTSDVSIHQDIDRIERIYLGNTSKCIAIGECGLDYYFIGGEIASSQTPRNDVIASPAPDGAWAWQSNIKDLQHQLFQAQIDLAKKLNLPLIVHCRDDRSKGSGSTSSPPQETSSPSAWDEVLKMVGNHPTILHCYSGLPHTTNYILQTTNLLVSFAATLTYPKNEYLREAAKILPLEKIVLETDCPFLPPQSKRGMRNEPSAVLEIAQLIADIKEVSLEKVANQTTANVKQILKII